MTTLKDLHLHELMTLARQQGMDDAELNAINKGELIEELQRRGVEPHGTGKATFENLHLHEIAVLARQYGMSDEELDRLNKADIIAELRKRNAKMHGAKR